MSAYNHFINIFLSAAENLTLDTVSDSSTSSRQKKAHSKSRNGCLACKERRVKCDESYPSCYRCVKRGDICRRRPIRPRRLFGASTSKEAASVPPSISAPRISQDEALNIEQLKLFHQFQTLTCHTLPMISRMMELFIPMAFEHEYLMYIALCLAARHLDYLGPEGEKKNLNLSRKYLSHALRLYRSELLSPITDKNRDAILCTSLMLYFEAWSDTEILPPNANGDGMEYKISEDQLYTFGRGMKHVFSQAIHCPTENSCKLRSSILYDLAIHRPIHCIQKAISAAGHDCYGYQSFFEKIFEQQDSLIKHHFRKLPVPENRSNFNSLQPTLHVSMTYKEVGSREAYIDVARRFSILLSSLICDKQGHSIESSVLEADPGLLPDVARVVFSFPVLFHPTLMNMLTDGDPRFLVLLYHFFRIVHMQLPKDKCWWAMRRAESSEKFLEQKLWGNS